MRKTYLQLLEENELLNELVKLKNQLIRHHVYKNGGKLIQIMVKINRIENQLYFLRNKKYN